MNRLRKIAVSKLNKEPLLRYGLALYYNAYFDLDTERNHGQGWTSIPWHSIIHYADVYGLDEDQTERLVAHIKAMDHANIKKLSDDAEAKKGT